MIQRSFDELSAIFGGDRALAHAASVGPTAVNNWRKRGIPSAKWPALVAYARTHDLLGVTFERLVMLGPASIRTPHQPPVELVAAGQSERVEALAQPHEAAPENGAARYQPLADKSRAPDSQPVTVEAA